jgi:hypothetical protein
MIQRYRRTAAGDTTPSGHETRNSLQRDIERHKQNRRYLDPEINDLRQMQRRSRY